MPSPVAAELRRLLLILVATVVVLDGLIIGAYYALHINLRSAKTQGTFVAVWVVLTLLIVATMMKKIRQARRR
ncbi:MAG: hypothetical protein ACREMU_09325 [Gemmatimonadaceae bacterium]